MGEREPVSRPEFATLELIAAIEQLPDGTVRITELLSLPELLDLDVQDLAVNLADEDLNALDRALQPLV